MLLKCGRGNGTNNDIVDMWHVLGDVCCICGDVLLEGWLCTAGGNDEGGRCTPSLQRGHQWRQRVGTNDDDGSKAAMVDVLQLQQWFCYGDDYCCGDGVVMAWRQHDGTTTVM